MLMEGIDVLRDALARLVEHPIDRSEIRVPLDIPRDNVRTPQWMPLQLTDKKGG